MDTNLILSIDNHVKPIPYESDERSNSINHGFKSLKERLHDVNTIPEAQDNNHIKSALALINGNKTALFTVGCEKAFNHDEHGHWARGYIEFSFNHSELIADAQWYFKLFFEFNNHIKNSGFDFPVQFHWELGGAIFLDAIPQCHGYTCGIWITTSPFDSATSAKDVWETSLDFLADYLGQIEKANSKTIY